MELISARQPARDCLLARDLSHSAVARRPPSDSDPTRSSNPPTRRLEPSSVSRPSCLSTLTHPIFRPRCTLATKSNFLHADSFDDWTQFLGNSEILTDAEFDWDGLPGELVALGNFFFLSTNGSAGDSGSDRDESLGNEFDVAQIYTQFAPKHPCYLSWFYGLYSSEPGQKLASDDIFWVGVENGDEFLALAQSVPGVSGSFWPDSYPFSGIARTVASSGATNGSFFLNGGGAGGTQYPASVGGNGLAVYVGFGVGDQIDGAIDSGMLVDQVACDSALVFASGFEILTLGTTIEWDGVVGEAP